MTRPFLLFSSPIVIDDGEESEDDEYKDPDNDLDDLVVPPTVWSLDLHKNPTETYGFRGQQIISFISEQNLQSRDPLARRTWRLFCGYRIIFCNGLLDYFGTVNRLILPYLTNTIRIVEEFCQVPIPADLNSIGQSLGVDVAELRAYIGLLFTRGPAQRQANPAFRNYFQNPENSSMTLVKLILRSLVEKKRNEDSQHEINLTVNMSKRILEHLIEKNTLSFGVELEKSFHSKSFIGYSKHRPIDVSVFASNNAVVDNFNAQDMLPQLSCLTLVEVARHSVGENLVQKDFVKAMEAAAVTMAAKWKFLSESGKVTLDEFLELRQYIFLVGSQSTSVYVVGLDPVNFETPPDIYSVKLSYSIDFPLLDRDCDVDACLFDVLQSILKWQRLSELMIADGDKLLELLTKAAAAKVGTVSFQTPGGTTSTPHQSSAARHANTPTPMTRVKRPLQSAPITQSSAKRHDSHGGKGKRKQLFSENLVQEMSKRLNISHLQEMYLEKVKSSVVNMKMGKFNNKAVVIKVKYVGSLMPRVRSFEMEQKLKELENLRSIVTVYMQEWARDDIGHFYQISVESYLIPVSRAFAIMSHGFSLRCPDLKPSKGAAALVLCNDCWSALSNLHERNILHCDIKDVNIMYDPIIDRYVLIDLDHGRHMSNGLSIRLRKHRFGTMGWYAPELGISNQENETLVPESMNETWDEWCVVTCSSEVYSMALVLYRHLNRTISVNNPIPCTIASKLCRDFESILSMEDPLQRPSALQMYQVTRNVIEFFGSVDQVRQLVHARF